MSIRWREWAIALMLAALILLGLGWCSNEVRTHDVLVEDCLRNGHDVIEMPRGWLCRTKSGTVVREWD